MIVGAGDDEWSALHEVCSMHPTKDESLAAADMTRVEVVELLLQHGADVSLPAHERRTTPLHEAAGNGYVRVVKRLLAAGADVNAKWNDGQTPLSRSAFHNDVTALLRQHGQLTSNVEDVE